MSLQKFYADPKHTFEFSNKAVGFRPTGGPFDVLGPYAKVVNCPIAGTELRRTCYATGYADTYWSVPAATRLGGKYIGGYFSVGEGAIEFRPMDKFKPLVGEYVAKLARNEFEIKTRRSA